MFNEVVMEVTMSIKWFLRLTVMAVFLAPYLSLLDAQPIVDESSPIGSVLSSISVNAKGGFFLGGGGYGSVATAGIGYPVALIPPQLNGNLFGDDVSFEFSAGSGYWSRSYHPVSSSYLEVFEFGIKVPILTPLKRFDLAIRPSFETPIVGDHRTGYHDFVPTYSIGLQLDLGITSWIQATAEYRWSREEPHGFLWTTNYQTLNLGLSVRLGDAFSKAKEYVHRSKILQERLSQTQDSLKYQRSIAEEMLDHLRKDTQTSKIDGSVQLLISEVKSLKAEMKQRNESMAIASLDDPPSERQPLTQVSKYDKTRFPGIRKISVTKRVFDGGVLVEEDYLKGILATLNNYDGYVWQIAYRDSGFDGSTDGNILAEKMWDFFKIYDANFDRRMCLKHDPTLTSQFEIRCLGKARD
jgi:hypothetical protein